jgi:hypothetical protein
MIRKSGGTKRSSQHRAIVRRHVLYLHAPWVVGNLAVLRTCYRLHARNCDGGVFQKDEIKHTWQDTRKKSGRTELVGALRTVTHEPESW